jgi:hypothetical protein
MSEERMSPQFEGAVQLQSALMGLTLAFKEKYGDEALEVAKNFIKQLGMNIGNQVKKQANIAGSDLKDIEKVLHAWQDPVVLGPPPKSNIEGKRLNMAREGSTQCPALHVAKRMNLPLKMVCETVAFPMFRGVAASVNPKAKHISVQIASEKCIDAIEI